LPKTNIIVTKIEIQLMSGKGPEWYERYTTIPNVIIFWHITS